MWKIGAEDIRSFPLPLPRLDVQQEIVDRISAIRREVARRHELADRMAEETKTEVEDMILGTKKVDCREANKIN